MDINFILYTLNSETGQHEQVGLFVKVSVYPKFDHFSKKLFFAFSDRSYCNLSFKKNFKKKD